MHAIYVFKQHNQDCVGHRDVLSQWSWSSEQYGKLEEQIFPIFCLEMDVLRNFFWPHGPMSSREVLKTDLHTGFMWIRSFDPKKIWKNAVGTAISVNRLIICFCRDKPIVFGVATRHPHFWYFQWTSWAWHGSTWEALKKEKMVLTQELAPRCFSFRWGRLMEWFR